MQGARVWSLVGELRSHMPCGMAKKKKGGGGNFIVCELYLSKAVKKKCFFPVEVQQ